MSDTDYIAEAVTEAFGERCPDFNEGCHCCRAWAQYDALRKQVSDAVGALEEAAGTLEGLSYIHDGNPSNAMADMPAVEYARHMLYEARQMAKAAHSEARATLASLKGEANG